MILDANNKFNFPFKLSKSIGKFTLQYIFNYLRLNRLLDLIRYNKTLQKLLNKNISDYEKEYKKIEIEIELNKVKNKKIKFINIPKKEESFYHIFFDTDYKEVFNKSNYIIANNNINKVKIIIDNGIKSLKKLFADCKYIKSINIIKFNNTDIINMAWMFDRCFSLKEINLSKVVTDKVKNMSSMFCYCSSLKEINLSSFETNNVRNMSWMFCDCKSLESLNISSFSTKNVKNMRNMFCGC